MQRSLKARALQALAQREQSRAELWRKLLPHARADEEAARESARHDGAARRATAHDAGAPAGEPEDAEANDGASAAERVEALLDWLESNRYLSQERFVESRVNARAPRFGNLRIRQELKQHQVSLSAEAAQALAASELGRARAVRERKFPEPAATAPERARQARFLAGRGFSPETIRSAMRDLRASVARDADGSDHEID